jgi:hypothetical protein
MNELIIQVQMPRPLEGNSESLVTLWYVPVRRRALLRECGVMPRHHRACVVFGWSLGGVLVAREHGSAWIVI